jgi:CRP/FNR family transcriptional regulator
MSEEQLVRLDDVVGSRRALRRGEAWFRVGETFNALFTVRTGFFKTCVTSEDGRDQVTGSQMADELLGLDGIGSDRHACDAVALED